MTGGQSACSRFVSTRGSSPAAGLRAAALRGLADDGGLYLPTSLPTLPSHLLTSREDSAEEWPASEVVRTAAEVLSPFLSAEVDGDGIRQLAGEALGIPLPARPLEPGTHVLELFHGPTGSFKDFGARFLAALLGYFRRKQAWDRLVVLTATSGDTGGAAAHALARTEDVEAVILFPRGGISPVQRRQITSSAARPGSGVRAFAVDGRFDDCQRMVKSVLADPGPGLEGRVTSANSVNIGRLLPQILFYVRAGRIRSDGQTPVVVVPSGNLGNLTAGVMARRMGVSLGRLVAAGNANGALARYLAGEAASSAVAIRTRSSAMDVAHPSNLERLTAFYGGGVSAMGREILATSHGDVDTLAAMRQVHHRTGYLMDPHTAVGWLGLETARKEGLEGSAVLLATAHPAKFPETVAEAVDSAALSGERWHVDAGPSADTDVPVLEPSPGALRGVLRGG